MNEIMNMVKKLEKLNWKNMYNDDFLLTWEKTDDELGSVFEVADSSGGSEEL